MRRLERIEKIKAKERQKFLNGRTNSELTKNFQEAKKGETAEIVAKESGFGSSVQYRKAKFIAENADPVTIAKLDADEISIHRAWKETKARLEAAQRRYIPLFAPVRWRRVPFGTKLPYEGANLITRRCFYSKDAFFA